jgi:hypothetical protein
LLLYISTGTAITLQNVICVLVLVLYFIF